MINFNTKSKNLTRLFKICFFLLLAIVSAHSIIEQNLIVKYLSHQPDYGRWKAHAFDLLLFVFSVWFISDELLSLFRTKPDETKIQDQPLSGSEEK